MRTALAAVVTAAFALSSAGTGADPVADPAAENWLIRGGGRVTLHVEVDGIPLAAVWAAALGRLFDDLDRDGNGTLGRAEAVRAPSALRVRQLGWGYLFAAPEPAAWDELDTPKDVAVTHAEFVDYYRRAGSAGVHVVLGTAPPAGPLTDALLKHLDANGDGAVARAEWEAAATALRRLDRDDDEVIRPDELVPRTTYPGTAGGRLLPRSGVGPPANAAGLPLVRLPANAAPPRRDAGPVFVVRLGRRPDGLADGAADVTAGGVRLRVYPVAGKLPDEYESARRLARARFGEVDIDEDGSLTRDEVAKAGYAPLRDHFASADRDGDGRLTRSEWDRYLDLRGALVAAQVVVTVFDHGPGLFELLDADGDGGLSVRELRGAWARLAAAGCVTDGAWARDRLPRHLRTVVSRGLPKSLAYLPPRSGPDWFRAMDRNGDGDVSRREFLGTDTVFRRLDADGDGLISPAEAVKAGPPGSPKQKRP